MASIQLLREATPLTTPRTLLPVGGAAIRITHKGKREIYTTNGTIALKEVYYAKGLEYNLISVPTLEKHGFDVVFSKNGSYIGKGGERIYLTKHGGLWALPDTGTVKVAALRMGQKGHADARTWHERLGHASKQKTATLVKRGLIPHLAREYEPRECRTCQLTNPGRRPVPKVAERSGEVTVQVDYMPVGQNESGWKGEVGAMVFSCRTSKVIKAYPMKSATTIEAIKVLDDYITNIVPLLKEGVTCIQTDAGSQFLTDGWRQKCAANGIES